jgi:hypothetical protein
MNSVRGKNISVVPRCYEQQASKINMNALITPILTVAGTSEPFALLARVVSCWRSIRTKAVFFWGINVP